MPRRAGSLYVDTITRRHGDKLYTSHLLRRKARRDGKSVTRTVGNISHLPPDLVELIRGRLNDGQPLAGGSFSIRRTLPHGHVAAAIGTIRNIGLDKVLSSRPSRELDIVLALIVDRIVSPASKLAAARRLRPETAATSLPWALPVEGLKDREVYDAMDWLLARQVRIENKLARRHLVDGTLVLYDLSGSYYTGKEGGLVRHGYSRDGRRGLPQVVYGLVCDPEGRPISVEVFPGNTADNATLMSRVEQLRRRFKLRHVVVVGDRGMVTSRIIDEHLREDPELDWITTLRAPTLKRLAAAGELDAGLFDDRGLATIESPEFPGERLIACRNPLLAEKRRRSREELLAATEAELARVAEAVGRRSRPLHGAAAIGLRVGEVLNKFKMRKHFVIEIGDDRFAYRRDEASIAAEAALDGLYVVRTSLASGAMDDEETVRSYKGLSRVERAFRCLKTTDLQVRPIYHRLDDRIRAHVFLCMLAYYVEWHMRERLAPMLFVDEAKAEAAGGTSPVGPAVRSASALRKDREKADGEGRPLHSFRTLLSDLGTLSLNEVVIEGHADRPLTVGTDPTEVQSRALELLEAPA